MGIRARVAVVADTTHGALPPTFCGDDYLAFNGRKCRIGSSQLEKKRVGRDGIVEGFGNFWAWRDAEMFPSRLQMLVVGCGGVVFPRLDRSLIPLPQRWAAVSKTRGAPHKMSAAPHGGQMRLPPASRPLLWSSDHPRAWITQPVLQFVVRQMPRRS